jgi:AcrR family transcriptional regulator
MTRRERERLKNRRTMLEAARAVFAEKSYADATVEEIAERAQFGKGTIYLYFKGGKQEILSTLLDELYDEIREPVERLVVTAGASATHSRTLLEDHVVELIGIVAKNRELFIVSLKEADRDLPGSAEGDQRTWNDRLHEVLILLARFFGFAVERREIKDVDPMVLAYLFSGLVQGYLKLVFEEKERAALATLDARQTARSLVSLFYDGVALRPTE